MTFLSDRSENSCGAADYSTAPLAAKRICLFISLLALLLGGCATPLAQEFDDVYDEYVTGGGIGESDSEEAEETEELPGLSVPADEDEEEEEEEEENAEPEADGEETQEQTLQETGGDEGEAVSEETDGETGSDALQGIGSGV